MTIRRVRTGAGYVADPGGGKAVWMVTYADVEVTPRYVADPGGGKGVWGYDSDTAIAASLLLDDSGAAITDESGGYVTDE